MLPQNSIVDVKVDVAGKSASRDENRAKRSASNSNSDRYERKKVSPRSSTSTISEKRQQKSPSGAGNDQDDARRQRSRQGSKRRSSSRRKLSNFEKYLRRVTEAEGRAVRNMDSNLKATTFRKRVSGTRPVHLVRCLKAGETEEVVQTMYIAPDSDVWRGFNPEDMKKCGENESFEYAIYFNGACLPSIDFDYDGFTDWIVGDQVAHLVDVPEINHPTRKTLCVSLTPWIGNPCSGITPCCPLYFLSQSLWLAVPSVFLVIGCTKVAILKRKVLEVYPNPQDVSKNRNCFGSKPHVVLKFASQWHTSRFHQSCMASTAAPFYLEPEQCGAAPKVQKDVWR